MQMCNIPSYYIINGNRHICHINIYINYLSFVYQIFILTIFHVDEGVTVPILYSHVRLTLLRVKAQLGGTGWAEPLTQNTCSPPPKISKMFWQKCTQNIKMFWFSSLPNCLL